MVVILGDWRAIPAIASQPTLCDDVAEMQAQVAALQEHRPAAFCCRRATRRILEPDHGLPLPGCAGPRLACHALGGALRLRQPGAPVDRPMVADATWSKWFSMCWTMPATYRRTGSAWLPGGTRKRCIRVHQDQGGLRAHAILAQLGPAPPVHQGRPGGGLGLFLAMNVARTLGGSVQARNHPEGGAQVTIACRWLRCTG